MSHDSAAAVVGTELIANATQGLAAGAAASASIAGLPPAGADEVSLQASTAFATQAIETLGQVAEAQAELTRAGAAVTKIAGMYAAIDGGASSTLT
jgi:hypothetical protein